MKIQQEKKIKKIKKEDKHKNSEITGRKRG